jgi:CheY-like chemotaxis protein/predicted regulator of Ras-like GTPase activity (Roadblock/LC7/MglB family)
MKKIVIVDDENNFLLSLKDGLSEFSDTFSILPANNGQEALGILAEEEVHLVITDIKMPVMDGFELLAAMSNDYADIPVIVMTAFGSSEIEDRLDSMGAFQYVEKPIDFDVLTEKVHEGLAAAEKGHITGVSLSSFMQLLSLDKKTCTLKIKSGHHVGTIFFANGELLHAFTESLQGQDAALEISCWDPVEIEIQHLCRQREQVIDAPLGYILIESARMKDEKAELAATGNKEPEKEEKLAPDAGQPQEVDPASLVSAPEDPASLIEEGGSPVQPPEEPAISQEVALLLEVITPIKGVDAVLVAQKDGEMIVETNNGGALCAYYAALVSQVTKMNTELRTSSPRTFVLNERSGRKVLIVNGPQIFVAMVLGNEASPDAVVGSISPMVQRLTV